MVTSLGKKLPPSSWIVAWVYQRNLLLHRPVRVGKYSQSEDKELPLVQDNDEHIDTLYILITLAAALLSLQASSSHHRYLNALNGDHSPRDRPQA
ncbi:MAG: hypothetical protein Q9194_000187 [Teloschistes cf. exilis]